MRPLPKRAADGALPGTRAPSWVYACVRGVVRAVFWPAFRALYGFRITGERQQALKALHASETASTAMPALYMRVPRRLWRHRHLPTSLSAVYSFISIIFFFLYCSSFRFALRAARAFPPGQAPAAWRRGIALPETPRPAWAACPRTLRPQGAKAVRRSGAAR